MDYGRPSYGGRGLKYIELSAVFISLLSPLVWGAWIEMRCRQPAEKPAPRRPSYGGRGLKFPDKIYLYAVMGRPSYGGRGLKSIGGETETYTVSRPSYGGRGLKYQVYIPCHLPG